MLNRLPGPGVHAVRPDTSMSQRLDVSVAVPGIRQLIPMTAIGSTEPDAPEVSCLLTTDHGVDGNGDEGNEEERAPLPLVSLLTLEMAGWSMSSGIVKDRDIVTWRYWISLHPERWTRHKESGVFEAARLGSSGYN